MDQEKEKENFLLTVMSFDWKFSDEVLQDFCNYWLQKVFYRNGLTYRFLTKHSFDYNRRLISFRDNGAPGKTKKEIAENLLQRQEQFRERVYAFKEQYPQEMLDAFFLYWSETNEEGKKMKWEKKDSFNVKARLATWHKNSKDYGNNRKPFKARDPQRDYTFEEFERDKRAGKF